MRSSIRNGKSKDVAKQILANPKVEISAIAAGKWIRLSGKLVLDDRFEDATATFCSFTDAPETVTF
ncbi:MAG: hypothetical protein K6G04_00265 [Lachnospiraceae bacterium]|nr:hypothetical protein [Lachnospiraceae bacterium]